MTLAYDTRTRQDDSAESYSSPSPSPTFFDFALYPDFVEAAAFPSHLPPAIDLSYCGPETEDYIIDSRQSTPYDTTFSDPSDQQYMANNYSPNPRLRILQSTPNVASSAATPPPMSEGSNWVQPSWNNFHDHAYLSPQASQASAQQFNTPQSLRSHKRVSSDSSVGSAGPDSPYTQSSVYPHIVDTDTHSASSPHLDPYDASYQQHQQFAKPLYYTPTNALSASLVNPAFQNLNISNNDAGSMMARQNAMREVMAQQNASNMNAGQQNVRRSFRREGSSMNAPIGLATNIPKLDRTVSDVYQDELFDSSIPSSATGPPSQAQYTLSQAQMLSPHRSVFNDRLQAANTARSVSPTTDMSRERSPFRDDSVFAGQTFPSNPSTSVTSRISSAAQIREQQKMQEDARAYAQHHPRPGAHQDFGAAPNTISPKEALLDYNEAAEDAKISSLPRIKREAEFSSAHSVHNQFVRANNTTTNGIENNNTRVGKSHNEYASTSSNSRRTPNLSSSQQSTSSNNYTFMPPNNPGPGGTPQPSYPFISQSRRQGSSMRSEQSDQQVPEFPSTLTSMESTKSESGPESNIRPPAFASQETASSQRSEAASPLHRPTDTSANSGSYTCVATNCNARFDTSAKLQKHRRENHRTSPAHHASSPTTATTSSSNTPHPHQNAQAAANNVSRNNAPGPHKCERVNPSTGKPCNTIFSRSYDLTRHEDTIHNNRKQKVRCHLCTEEKTFSRNDALTRHMRVVHPDVDFPGRNRRRG